MLCLILKLVLFFVVIVVIVVVVVVAVVVLLSFSLGILCLTLKIFAAFISSARYIYDLCGSGDLFRTENFTITKWYEPWFSVSKKVLYLRWNEHRLSVYFGTLITRLSS